MLVVKIVDQKKFDKVSEVEFIGRSIFRGAFTATVCIIMKDHEELEFYGEHGVNDWVDDFGFVVIEIED